MLFNAADKALWRLALPMIFSNITVPLLGLVDTAVIGHLDSPVYLGGVAVGATATSFLFMLLLFLRMSTTGLTAQAFGARDPQRLARALVQPLGLALAAGAAIVVLRMPLIDLALHIVGGSEAVLEQARRFLELRWLSAPASLANLVLLGWLLGVQYARAPVILLVVGNVLNIVLDLWLVMGLHMNVQGAGDGHRRIRHFLYWPADGETRAGAARRFPVDAEKRLARRYTPPAGAESRHHAALAAATALLRGGDGIWRPPRRRCRRGQCGPHDDADLYRLCAGRFCLCR